MMLIFKVLSLTTKLLIFAATTFLLSSNGNGNGGIVMADQQQQQLRRNFQETDVATTDGDEETEGGGPPITPSYQVDLERNKLPTCFDYRAAFDIGKDGCRWDKIFHHIRDEYEKQSKEDWALKWSCHGGLTRELMTLTGVDDNKQWIGALEKLCSHATGAVVTDHISKDVDWPELGPGVDNLDQFFAGGTVLNSEYGNLRNIESEFVRRGGYDRYSYIGPDPRHNDYLATTEESFEGGESIKNFFENESKKVLLKSPSSSIFGDDEAATSCPTTNTMMCCWSKDRQYNDNNGGCSLGSCINRFPGDNTDLCWTTEDGEVYPYPNPKERERDMHCHGISWGQLHQDDDDAPLDVNEAAKWNSLFYVAMYDHLYKRGYSASVTNATEFAGEQPMCGCVEDMNPVARADCNEARATANYTLTQNQESGLLELDYKEDSFEIVFDSCQGWEYKDSVTPDKYQTANNVHALGLRRKTNDLSAKVFKLHLEGKLTDDHVGTYEQTVVGYKHTKVNTNDSEREKVCQAAFEEAYPGEPWEIKPIPGDDLDESTIEL